MNALRSRLVGASRYGITIVLALVFGFLGSQAATVFGARGDANVINACVQTRSGEIRVVAANAACRANEYHIDWNLGGGLGGGGGTPPPSFSGLEVVWDSTPPDSIPSLTVYCPAGKKAIGGGAATLSGGALYVSRPVGPNIGEPYYDNGVPTGTSGTSTLPGGWTARYTGDNQILTVYAICAKVGP